MSMQPEQRFTRDAPCPICGGYDGMPRGREERCFGFLSSDTRYAHCTREEWAGALPFHDESGTYAHRLDGPCGCGASHGPTPTRTRGARSQVLDGSHFDRCPKPYPCDYTDEGGTVLFRVARWNHRDGSKTYAVYRPDGNGGWVSGLGDARRLPYHLPEALAAVARGEPLYIAEGEKNVEALHAIGIAATCNPMGAGKWRENYTELLKNAERVRVTADNDEDGRAHARAIATSFHRIGVPDLRMLHFPELPGGGDISDWLAAPERAGLSADQKREALFDLVEATPRWRPAPAPTSP